ATEMPGSALGCGPFRASAGALAAPVFTARSAGGDARVGIAPRTFAATAAAVAPAAIACAVAGAPVLVMFCPGLLARWLGQGIGLLHEIPGQRRVAELHPGQPLNVAQIGLFVRRDVGHRQARPSGARGAA